MEFEKPQVLTPEEKAEAQKQRTISDAELLKEGAKYEMVESGPQKGELRLDVNQDQIDNIEFEHLMDDMGDVSEKLREKVGELFWENKRNEQAGKRLKEIIRGRMPILSYEEVEKEGEDMYNLCKPDKNPNGDTITKETFGMVLKEDLRNYLAGKNKLKRYSADAIRDYFYDEIITCGPNIKVSTRATDKRQLVPGMRPTWDNPSLSPEETKGYYIYVGTENTEIIGASINTFNKTLLRKIHTEVVQKGGTADALREVCKEYDEQESDDHPGEPLMICKG